MMNRRIARTSTWMIWIFFIFPPRTLSTIVWSALNAWLTPDILSNRSRAQVQSQEVSGSAPSQLTFPPSNRLLKNSVLQIAQKDLRSVRGKWGVGIWEYWNLGF